MAAIRSAAEMEQLRREFLVRAQAAFEQMFGADGQNGLVTFTEREDWACEVTDALARRSGRTGESGLHERSYTRSGPPSLSGMTGLLKHVLMQPNDLRNHTLPSNSEDHSSRVVYSRS